MDRKSVSCETREKYPTVVIARILGMASRNKFTPEIADTIIQHVRDGNYFQTAARAAGIHRDTLYSWLSAGAEGDPRYVEFHGRLREAEALAEIDAVAKVREAKQGWQAHMTFLERRHSERWSRAERAGQEPRGQMESADEFFRRKAEEREATELRAVYS
jgi:hypothetical protein